MKCKKWLKKAVMSLLLAVAMTLSAFTGIIPGIVIESRAEDKTWPDLTGNVYKITSGGTYTCPNSLNNQVKISGGTQDDPVIIKIGGTVTATTSAQNAAVFRIDNGYTEFVGLNEAKITTDRQAFSFNQDTSSFTSLSIRDVIIDGGNTSSGSDRFNILNIQPSVGGSTLSLENVKVKNWISTNTSTGGAVFLKNVTATLTNCEFDNLKAPNVGALIAADNSSVTLNGCSFTNCIAAGGGSADGGGALRVNSGASLTVNNCTFSGCKSLGSDKNRGVVYVRNGGTLTLKGSTTITGNTAQGENVYLPNGAKIKVDGFTGKAGITMASPGVFTNGYNSETDPSTYFISDNTNYAVSLTAGKEAQLVQRYLVSFDANGHGTAPDAQTVASGGLATEPTAPIADGYIFDGWYKEAACTNPWDFASDTVTSATILYAKWTVAYEVTYKVANGTWSDGSMTDRKENVRSGSKPASVPTGMKASSGYMGGAWDTDPANATISEAKTFTYTFTAIPTYTVTYKVVNGTWSDDSTTDKAETVQSGSKPASVPTGMKASQGFTGGAWDTDPANATITGAKTFTYTFTAIPTYTVTYKVVNGTWSDDSTTDKAETVQSGSKPASVPTGMIASSGYTGGAWDTNPAEATITEAKTFTYTFTTKQAATVTKAPTAKTLTYTGAAQELVTAGEADGGTMQYALGTATEATEPYTTSIPAKTNAGTYYVWYKVVGDENHTDTEPKVLKVTIDVAKGETKIETEVQTDEKSPKLEASNLTKEVAESTLTDEEKAIIDEAVNDGKDVNVDVYLTIHDIADEITAEDKAKLEAEASDADQLAYFDISLFKEIIVDGTSLGATAISELQKPLKLTIGVPNSFPAVETGYTRTYTVLRLHKGEVTTLPTTVNADGTISFETDRFSVYALVYKDTKEATTTEATTAATAAASTSDATTATAAEAAKTSPKTGDSMPIAVMVVLMFAAAGMLVFMDLKKKKN